MADIATPCSCFSYENNCCGTCRGITVAQPKCQELPDGRIVNNPAYVPDIDKSFWSYKFFVDCYGSTKPLDYICIPVCKTIHYDQIVVWKKNDGCGKYETVPFKLIPKKKECSPPSSLYQFIKIDIKDRFQKGICVEYRIEIDGDFPVSTSAVKFKTGKCILYCGCKKCFLVPGCWPEGRLTIKKECRSEILNNQTVLLYKIFVRNAGKKDLNNVLFHDTIYIPLQLTPGSITLTPSTLNINASMPGQIKIQGNLGTVMSGQSLSITCKIPITSVSEPGQYFIRNIATVSSVNTSASAACHIPLNVAKLKADKCCSIDDRTMTFTLLLSSNDSPDISVNLMDHMQIPAGITIKFISYNCEAYFSGTDTQVPTNVNITGPTSIDFICKNIIVEKEKISVKRIRLALVSSSVKSASIINTITDVTPVHPRNQIFLGTSNLPVSAEVNIHLDQLCNQVCEI